MRTRIWILWQRRSPAPTLAPKGVVTCSVCKAVSHVECHVRAGRMQLMQRIRNISVMLVLAMSAIRDVFIAQGGGLFKPTSDGRWCHIYCGNSLGGVSRLAGNTDLRIVPKAFVKQKCCICTQKYGFVVKCQAHGCNSYFHSLCGEEDWSRLLPCARWRYYRFLLEHLPDGIEKGSRWVLGGRI